MSNLKPTGISTTEEEVFAVELGGLVFQSALAQFLAALNDEESDALEEFIEKNANSEDLLEQLFKMHPDFEDILKAEMAITEQEVKEIIPE